MEAITLKQMQNLELEMLKALKKVCETHGLRYYVDGGTLLGAYCYGAFIPWDDDIDIKMPRPDYEKLSDYRDEFPKNIRIVRPEEDGYCYTFTKIEDTRTVLIENPGSIIEHIGSVYIDIFPLDGHNEKTLRKMERYKTLFHFSKNGFPNTIKGKIYSMIFTPEKTYKKMTVIAKSTEYDCAKDVGLLVDGDTSREKFPREALDDCAYISFEGEKYPAPSNYLEHLCNFYGKDIVPLKGNLPQIPSGHTYQVFWKE